MLDERRLHLGGADPIAGGGDDVVLAPDEAERPVRLSNGTVARDVIIAHKRLLGALVIAFEPEERRGAVDCKQARFARRELLAVRCYRRNLEAGHRIAEDRKSTRLNSSHKCATRMPT